MSSALLQRPGLGPVEPATVYPLADLQARTGLGAAAIREARRNGLRVKYMGGRAYIKGAWWIDYLEAHGKDTK
jgi:hypothetical protein